jgi:CRP-like cAMP-binding protein
MSNELKVGFQSDNEQTQLFLENYRTFSERLHELEDAEEREIKKRKKEKQSIYSNWYQFNREHSKEIMWLASEHPKAQVLLLFILDKMDNYNALVCSYQVFQEALGVCKSTVTRNLNVLKDNGFIFVLKSGTSNVYVVNKELAWSSWGSNFKYCKFPSNIILTASENKELFNK